MAHTPITPQTYNRRSKEIPFSKMPKDLADTHGEMPMYLEFYGQDPEITEVVDLYLSKVNAIMNKPAAAPTCKPKTIYKDKVIYKDKIVKQPCDVDGQKKKSFTDKLKDPVVIGVAVAGLIIGKVL